MEFVGLACEHVIAPFIPCIYRRIKYAKDFEKNFGKLEKELEDLNAFREDVEEQINRDTTMKIPSNECQNWLRKVDKIQSQLNDIEKELVNMRCFGGWCPNISLQMKLGKLVVTKINDVIELKKDFAFKGGVVVDKPQEIVEIIPPQNIMVQPSTQQTFQELLRCIEDENVGKIGVWGMGGVGKTTMMKQLGSLPKIPQMFNIVIWITISNAWNFRKIQNDIAERLSINWRDISSTESLAFKIFQKLQSMKYLLLVDDVWENINLEELGVPNPTIENGCKIVLTSRYLNVCKAMGIDKDIRASPLSHDEAWDLFQICVGEVANTNEIKEQARSIVEECQGLPLAIVVIGSSLRKENNVHVWRNALQELRTATFEIGDMEDSVYKKLKFSYDRLKNDSTKDCFLYCALYPEDFVIKVSELVSYWRAEGFIKGMQDSCDKGHRILNELVAASLLEKVDDQSVKMHDMIRDLALRITSLNGDGPRFLVKAGVGIKDCLNEEEWEHAKRISFMRNDIIRLPGKPKCNSLSTLFLQENRNLTTIPEHFFANMHELRVLDLSWTALKAIPTSISNLIRLQALYIRSECCMTLPSEVRALKSLEVLHLWWIDYLPPELQELTRLRSLHVGFGTLDAVEEERNTMICVGLISKLGLLEDLKFQVAEANIEKRWKENVDATLIEDINSLRRLSSLQFHFPTTEDLENFISGCVWKDQCLISFQFKIGNFVDPSLFEKVCNHENQRCLHWRGGDGMPNAIKEILNKACVLQLDEHSTIQSLSEFGIENIGQLHYCEIAKCNKLEVIIDENDSTLSNLSGIWRGQLPTNNLFALRYLNLCSCAKLSSIFSESFIYYFANLEELSVEHCEEVEVIVKEGDKTYEEILPKLKMIYLCNLPKLVSICEVYEFLYWPSLKEIGVLACPNLEALPFSDVDNVPALERIEGSKEWWWEGMKWYGTKLQLQNYFYPVHLC